MPIPSIAANRSSAFVELGECVFIEGGNFDARGVINIRGQEFLKSGSLLVGEQTAMYPQITEAFGITNTEGEPSWQQEELPEGFNLRTNVWDVKEDDLYLAGLFSDDLTVPNVIRRRKGEQGWTKLNLLDVTNTGTITGLFCKGNAVVFTTNTTLSPNQNAVFTSYDKGDTWDRFNLLNSLVEGAPIFSLSSFLGLDDGTLILSGGNGGFYRKTPGTGWIPFNFPLQPTPYIYGASDLKQGQDGGLIVPSNYPLSTSPTDLTYITYKTTSIEEPWSAYTFQRAGPVSNNNWLVENDVIYSTYGGTAGQLDGTLDQSQDGVTWTNVSQAFAGASNLIESGTFWYTYSFKQIMNTEDKGMTWGDVYDVQQLTGDPSSNITRLKSIEDGSLLASVAATAEYPGRIYTLSSGTTSLGLPNEVRSPLNSNSILCMRIK